MGTWFSSGFGSAGIMVGLDDLIDILNLNHSYYFIIFPQCVPNHHRITEYPELEGTQKATESNSSVNGPYRDCTHNVGVG